MVHFLFEVTSCCIVIGYDIYDHRKHITNYNIEEGFYLAFYDTIFTDVIEEDLIYFIYMGKVLMIRKKISIERKV